MEEKLDFGEHPNGHSCEQLLLARSDLQSMFFFGICYHYKPSKYTREEIICYINPALLYHFGKGMIEIVELHHPLLESD
jgi:hypothetical protein